MRSREQSHREGEDRGIAHRARHILLWLAVARAVLSVVALILLPWLWEHHFLFVVLMRPTKDILMLGGLLVRNEVVSLAPLIGAAIPLAILGVWQFFALGRGWASEIDREEVPGIGSKLLPHDKIDRLRETLEQKGARLVVLARIAAFPSSLLAAAAGSSEMRTRRFLLADAAGAVLAVGTMIAIGYLLGQAYDAAGPWLTALAVVALLAIGFMMGRALRR